MDEVQADEKLDLASGQLGDGVAVPDLIIEGSLGHDFLERGVMREV
jgi:hypothetical protein